MAKKQVKIPVAKAKRLQLVIEPELLEKAKEDAWKRKETLSEYIRTLIKRGI